MKCPRCGGDMVQLPCGNKACRYCAFRVKPPFPSEGEGLGPEVSVHEE